MSLPLSTASAASFWSRVLRVVSRVPARTLRWPLLAVGVWAAWACDAQPLARPTPDVVAVDQQTVRLNLDRKLDLLFMVDNSSSMSKLQNTMAANFRVFMDVFRDPTTQELPDLHIAVISSDMGAGRWSSSLADAHCNRPGGDQGAFHHTGVKPVGCLGPDGPYIIDSYGDKGERVNNYGSGNIADVFSCIALLGEGGCGFESQFGSTLAALEQDQGGFLRDDAYLAVVMLTNEDDCSVPPDSNLFDPRDMTPADQLGALWNYRCTEFGIACDQPLPHQTPASPVTLTNCHSKEDGVLLRVSDFVTRLKQVKANGSNRIFLAAIASPTRAADESVLPVSIRSTSINAGTGTVKIPELAHVCESLSADPGIRLAEAVAAFGKENGLFAPDICNADYTGPLSAIGKAIIPHLNPPCTKQKVAKKADGSPHCSVQDETKGSVPVELPFCNGIDKPDNLPCWHLVTGDKCTDGLQMKVERDPSVHLSGVTTHASCEVCLPGVTSAGCS